LPARTRVTKLPAITRPLELAAAAMQKSVGEEGGAVPCETLGEKREGAVVGSQLCGRPTYSPGLARPAGRNCQRPPASLLIIRRYVWERFFFFCFNEEMAPSVFFGEKRPSAADSRAAERLARMRGRRGKCEGKAVDTRFFRNSLVSCTKPIFDGMILNGIIQVDIC
jgi:hypothetical protein